MSSRVDYVTINSSTQPFFKRPLLETQLPKVVIPVPAAVCLLSMPGREYCSTAMRHRVVPDTRLPRPQPKADWVARSRCVWVDVQVYKHPSRTNRQSVGHVVPGGGMVWKMTAVEPVPRQLSRELPGTGRVPCEFCTLPLSDPAVCCGGTR